MDSNFAVDGLRPLNWSGDCLEGPCRGLCPFYLFNEYFVEGRKDFVERFDPDLLLEEVLKYIVAGMTVPDMDNQFVVIMFYQVKGWPGQLPGHGRQLNAEFIFLEILFDLGN